MHNLHFVVLKCGSPQEACETVEEYICGYGYDNDNNYYSIGGCVSEDNDVFVYDKDAAFLPDDEEYNSIDKIRDIVKGWMQNEMHPFIKEEFKKALRKPIGKVNWYAIEQYANNACEINGRTCFNIFEGDQFFGHQYDKNGVTQCTYDFDDPEFKKYVVFVDMHS